MKWIYALLLISGFFLAPAQANPSSVTTTGSSEKSFVPIVVKVMNRGTNILIGSAFTFILIYSIYVAIAVSFGSMESSAFVSIFWGAGIALAGGVIAKIYYVFLA